MRSNPRPVGQSYKLGRFQPPLCTWIVRLTAPYSDWGPFYVLTTPTLHQPGWGLLQLSICAWTCLLGHSCGWRTQAAGASSTAGPSGVGVSTTKFNPSPTPFDQIKSVEAVTNAQLGSTPPDRSVRELDVLLRPAVAVTWPRRSSKQEVPAAMLRRGQDLAELGSSSCCPSPRPSKRDPSTADGPKLHLHARSCSHRCTSARL